MPLTIESLRAFVKANKSLVNDLIQAREEAPKVRAAVEGVVNPLFANFPHKFWTEGRVRGWLSGKPVVERTLITDPNKLYMVDDMDSESMTAWDKARNEAILAAFPGTPDGFCPALMAESKIIELENALLESAAETLDGSFSNICNMKMRDEAVSLLATGVTNLRG